MEKRYFLGGRNMDAIIWLFTMFFTVLVLVVLFRIAKLIIRRVNKLFDKLEDR